MAAAAAVCVCAALPPHIAAAHAGGEEETDPADDEDDADADGAAAASVVGGDVAGRVPSELAFAGARAAVPPAPEPFRASDAAAVEPPPQAPVAGRPCQAG